MRLIVIALCCLPLSGCLFFYLPGGIFDSSNACVSENAVVGQRICNRDNGKCGTLKELKGRSDRCQNGTIPVKAFIEYD